MVDARGFTSSLVSDIHALTGKIFLRDVGQGSFTIEVQNISDPAAVLDIDILLIDNIYCNCDFIN